MIFSLFLLLPALSILFLCAHVRHTGFFKECAKFGALNYRFKIAYLKFSGAQSGIFFVGFSLWKGRKRKTSDPR